ncbi:MAG: eight-cysteine-cluster domain-containing protein [Candidatus Aenigmarchaeota archaeon]|nr:eight-cysteine-cluster domain-containing protein [Candidatus Aenigmarchaeota archaeon]
MGRVYLALGAIVLSVVFISGCVNISPEALALANPLVKQFMEEYPNAQITMTHFTENQSSNILENISAECGNPYIEAKEYYRITMNDPDSGLSVVAWVDWETKDIECAVKYGTGENKTISKPGEGEKQCRAHHEVKCYKGHVYWYDSCGNMESKKEYCDYGCGEGKCLETGCDKHNQTKCYEGHVYWYDSCGKVEEKKEYCEEGCEDGKCTGAAEFCGVSSYDECEYDSDCSEGGCSGQVCQSANEETNGTICDWQDCYDADEYSMVCKCVSEQCQWKRECATHHEYKCYENHVYWYDSCGSKEEKKEYCNDGCSDNKCINMETDCVDSDGGKNFFEWGTATKGAQRLSDHCNNDGTITEKYCEGNEIKADMVLCPNGYECSEGKCVETV